MKIFKMKQIANTGVKKIAEYGFITATVFTIGLGNPVKVFSQDKSNLDKKQAALYKTQAMVNMCATQAFRAPGKTTGKKHAQPAYQDMQLLKAVQKEDTVAMQKALDKGAGINAKDEDGWAPMHWAAAWNKDVSARYLFEKGADVNALNNNGDTPLDITVKFYNNIEVGNFLRINGGKTGGQILEGQKQDKQ